MSIDPSPNLSSNSPVELEWRGQAADNKGVSSGAALDGEKHSVVRRFALPDQPVFSACLAKRAKAVRDRRSILARTTLSLRFCLVAA
jgi:hypothetical protein